MGIIAEEKRQGKEVQFLCERRSGGRVRDNEIERSVLHELKRLRLAAEHAATEDVDLDAALAVLVDLLDELHKPLVPGVILLEVMRDAQAELLCRCRQRRDR
jgi:hypothetical protein